MSRRLSLEGARILIRLRRSIERTNIDLRAGGPVATTTFAALLYTYMQRFAEEEGLIVDISWSGGVSAGIPIASLGVSMNGDDLVIEGDAGIFGLEGGGTVSISRDGVAVDGIVMSDIRPGELAESFLRLPRVGPTGNIQFGVEVDGNGRFQEGVLQIQGGLGVGSRRLGVDASLTANYTVNFRTMDEYIIERLAPRLSVHHMSCIDDYGR